MTTGRRQSSKVWRIDRRPDRKNVGGRSVFDPNRPFAPELRHSPDPAWIAVSCRNSFLRTTPLLRALLTALADLLFSPEKSLRGRSGLWRIHGAGKVWSNG